MKQNQISQKKGRHLTYAKRCQIETLLSDGHSIRHIAFYIGCSPSTVSREIKKHSFIKKTHTNDCANKLDCSKRHACGSTSCNSKCKKCNRCKNYCDLYVKVRCSLLEEKMLCNGCNKIQYCQLDRRIYDAGKAETEYKQMLTDRRNGFDLTYEEIEEINQLVTPLIRKGQSPYHIKHTLGNHLSISEATLRRMINGSELDVRAIDLREAVKRKARVKRRRLHNEFPSALKAGHLYEDYLTYIEKNDVNVVQMDCIEGKIEDKCAILTLHFVLLHMQLYYIMPKHTSECVISVLNHIEETIGTALFQQMFEIILTDNGHEFSDIDGMEQSVISGKRTKIFFCEPNRSDQKGACENNHKLFRCIVPKGNSIDELIQTDLLLITNHINSYRRKSLFGTSPYEQAMKYIPYDFFRLLGLEMIPSDEIILNSSLLRK